MSLLDEIPALKEPITEGKLNLSNLSVVGQFFRQEKTQGGKEYKTSEKIEILKEVEKKTTNDCLKLLGNKSSYFAVKQRESVKPVNSSYVEMKLMVSTEFMEEVEELKNLLSHELKTGKASEVIECSVRKVLRSLRKKKGIEVPAKEIVKGKEKLDSIQAKTKPVKTNPTNPFAANKDSRYGSASDQRMTWRRAENQCEFVDVKTGRRCCSRWRLEIDPILPYSFNGKSDAQNLRLLCQMHHRLVTEKVFGRFIKK